MLYKDAKKEMVVNSVHHMRKKKGATQQELATAVGVTRQTIIAIEKGNYIPSVLLALKISAYFNTTVNSLFQYE